MGWHNFFPGFPRSISTALLFACVALLSSQVHAGELTAMQQVYIVKQLKPDIKSIGVLCNLEKHPELTNKLSRIAAQMSVKIYLFDTKEILSVSKNFKRMRRKKVDAIWVFPDEVLTQKIVADYLIRESVLAKIILMANDPAWVKKGATLCARSEEGEIRLYINEKAIGIMSLNLEEELKKAARVVMN